MSLQPWAMYTPYASPFTVAPGVMAPGIGVGQWTPQGLGSLYGQPQFGQVFGGLYGQPHLSQILGSVYGQPQFGPVQGQPQFGWGQGQFPLHQILGSLYGQPPFGQGLGNLYGQPQLGPGQGQPHLSQILGSFYGQPHLPPILSSLYGQPQFGWGQGQLPLHQILGSLYGQPQFGQGQLPYIGSLQPFQAVPVMTPYGATLCDPRLVSPVPFQTMSALAPGIGPIAGGVPWAPQSFSGNLLSGLTGPAVPAIGGLQPFQAAPGMAAVA